MTIRLSINISPETSGQLKVLAASRHTTITDMVRRAVSVYAEMSRRTRDGQEILIQDHRTGETTTVVLL